MTFDEAKAIVLKTPGSRIIRLSADEFRVCTPDSGKGDSNPESAENADFDERKPGTEDGFAATKLKVVESNLHDLQARLIEVREREKQLKSELEGLRKENQKLRTGRNVEPTVLKHFENEKTALENEKEGLLEEVTELQLECADLRSSLYRWERLGAARKALIDELKAENEGLHLEIESLRREELLPLSQDEKQFLCEQRKVEENAERDKKSGERFQEKCSCGGGNDGCFKCGGKGTYFVDGYGHRVQS